MSSVVGKGMLQMIKSVRMEKYVAYVEIKRSFTILRRRLVGTGKFITGVVANVMTQKRRVA